ncbi:MAG: hypothetical protein WCC03_02390 [Candidatus Acidiferrales bacterium]
MTLVAVLTLATLGCVWHHHASSTDTNCSICHLNHQAMGHPPASDRAPVLAAIGARFDPREPAFVYGPVISRIPARAPPAA